MMGHRERLKHVEEYDCVYGRGVFCYHINSSAPRKIKKQMIRRNRHKQKCELKMYKKVDSV